MKILILIFLQYLSGNVNGNNNTLVKVIAAVLKFTPQQTQVVLEKEAHRRSLVSPCLRVFRRAVARLQRKTVG